MNWFELRSTQTTTVRSDGGWTTIPDDDIDEVADLALDQIFKTLSNSRRRKICRFMGSTLEATTIGELAEHIAAAENNTGVEELSTTERKRVYVALYQCHLPQMDDANIIEFNEANKTIKPDDHLAEIYKCLMAVENRRHSEPTKSTHVISILSSPVKTILSAVRS